MPDKSEPERRPNRLETVRRACAVLKMFGDGEALSLAEIVERTSLERTIVFRLVHTLKEEGLLRKIDGKRYETNIRILSRKQFRIGYAAQASDSTFSASVTGSLRWAAARNQIELVVLDNRYSAKAALSNAHRLIAERVDLAIEFQTYEKIAPMIGSLFGAANIPLIAIEIPHPGATFYGIDNYRVGITAGKAMAKWVKQHWGGKFDELLLLELEIAGSLPHLRLSGAEAVIREAFPGVGRVQHLDTRGEFLRSMEIVRRHLRSAGKRRTLVIGVNDFAVLGALNALEEAGRSDACVGVGLGAVPEARAELRRPGTRLIGSIAFFPERYGDDLVRLALDILKNRSLPPAVYTEHRMITSQNVDEFYPRDLVSTGR